MQSENYKIMAEKTLEERLSELYEKKDHRDQFFDKDLKTLIDGIRDAREHGGSSDYSDLSNKPAINGVQLSGDKTPAQLGLATTEQVGALSDKVDKLPSGYYYGKFSSVEDLPEATEKGYAYVASSDPTVFYTYLVSGAGAEWVDSGNKMVNTIDITTPKTAGTELSKGEKYYANANISNRIADVEDATGVVRSLGYKVLNPAMSFAEQVEGVNNANTIFEIKDSFDLEGGSVTIPAGCTLKFEGGTVINGTVVGDKTVVASPPIKIFSNNCTLSGTWVGEGFCEWFGDNFEKCINIFKNIRLLPGKTYELSSTLKMPSEASIVGNGSSTIHTDGTFDVVWMGYKCTINGVIFKTDTPCNTIVVCFEQIAATRRVDEQTTSINYKGVDAHILIENVIIQSKGSANNAEVYAIKVISDGAKYNTISGFWGVTIRKVSIGGDYYYGVTFDNGTCENNVWANPWLTSCLVEDVTMANVRNCFFIGQNNKGSSNTSTVGYIVFRRCQAQRNWNIGYLQQAFFKIEKAANIFIEEGNPQDWAKTSSKVDADNYGEAGQYRVDRVNCSSIVLIASIGTVKLNGTGTKNPVALFGSYSSWKAFSTYTKQLNTDTWNPENGQYFTVRELNELTDGNYAVLYDMYSYMGLSGSGNSSYFAFTKFSMITTGGSVISLIIGRFVIEGGYASTRLVTMSITGSTNQDDGLESHWCYANLNPLKKVAYSSGERPSILTSKNKGISCYDTTLKKPIWWDGTTWIEEDGEAAGIKRTGTSAQRPTPTNIGFKYFDTSLGKPIYWNGSSWTDTNGETVGLQVSDTSVLIGAAAGSATINVYHANALNVTALNPDNTPATWLTVPNNIAVGTNTLTITAAANTASNPRGAKVIIEDGTDVVIVNVVQNYSTT